MNRFLSIQIIILHLFILSGSFAHATSVIDPARDIPLAYDVDVVVVGGSSAAVTAAVAAAKEGAKVFLAAERPYLGEDLCGTYRLWLEPDEKPITPLSKKLFAPPKSTSQVPYSLPFTYQADRPCGKYHNDSSPPELLKDGKWHNFNTQSVQYIGSVTIELDLNQSQKLDKVFVMAYQQRNKFEVEKITVLASKNRTDWKQVGVIKNDKLGQDDFIETALVLSAPIKKEARYLKLFVQKSEKAHSILLGEIVVAPSESSTLPAEKQSQPIMVTPMQVKHTLDRALIEAGVSFLFNSYTTEILQDKKGNPAGIVITNRSGRQAVRAKVVIDATTRANMARMAGANFTPYSPGIYAFERVVVGGKPIPDVAVNVRQIPTSIAIKNQPEFHQANIYTLHVPMLDNSYDSFALAEQTARDKTWSPEQVDASEVLFQVPPDQMKGRQSHAAPWPGADKINLDVFRPAGIKNLYVIGGCADISRDATQKLLRSLAFMQVGTRIGYAAAQEALQLPPPKDIRLTGNKSPDLISAKVSELGSEFFPRQSDLTKIPAEERALPIIGEYDVVVVGGGTGGAPAGIAAARQGAKTLVIEYLYGLGGVGTSGLISIYYYGNRVGFTEEIDQGIRNLGKNAFANNNRLWAFTNNRFWNIEFKMEWYRRQLRKAGADIWFGSFGSAAVVDKNRVKGVVIVTPQGRGVVLAKVVIDSTGNADIAAAAGARCRYIGASHVAVQGTGLPPRAAGAGYTNTDYTFVDDSDIIDIWRAYVLGREKYQGAYDLGQLIDTRERRQIVGDYFLTPMDIFNQRTFKDTIVISKSNFDTHGFTVHPLFMLRPPHRDELFAHVPYRCLLPRGLDGILVTGLGVSAHRDAIPVIRMQPDVQNQGYAAGVAAALAAKENVSTRELDIRQVQKILVQKGNLPQSVLTDQDYSIPKEKISQAVQKVVNNYEGLEIILDQTALSLPLLREAYITSDSEEDKIVYAHILGMLGDPTGAETLIKAVKASKMDKGWNYKGMGQFGASLSRLDSLIIALGRTRDDLALDVILDKAKQLNTDSEFSHFRAVSIAMETLADPRAAEPLAKLLEKPGITGHAYLDIDKIEKQLPKSSTDETTRNFSLRELILARALYRCGDYQGLGEKILNQYARDLRGHYARHAHAILNEKPKQTK